MIEPAMHQIERIIVKYGCEKKCVIDRRALLDSCERLVRSHRGMRAPSDGLSAAMVSKCVERFGWNGNLGAGSTFAPVSLTVFVDDDLLIWFRPLVIDRRLPIASPT